ncbi:MAG TPA: galactokinase [Blastocatellia bacterium]|nr:galactokinase [Blastocatellia bacterium]
MSQNADAKRIERQLVYRAPGRVNLIGEHTDYNEGFVFPAAIDLYTRVTVAPRNGRKLLIHSQSFSDDIEIDLDDSRANARGHWSDYVRGVALMLERAGHRLKGAGLDVSSTVPIGAGLSSSAALEVAAGYAMLETSGHDVDRLELAKLCQQAENEFVGMRCGIMDQFIACFGQAGHLLMLDCRSLEYRLAPLPPDVRLVICNTMIRHKLAASEYNNRRAECEAGVEYFARFRSEVRALRDVTIDDLESYGCDLPDAIRKRCRHVITENLRVEEAAAALEHGDLHTFGELMGASHRSLKEDYEVSCAELDTMVDLATQVEGVYGARMTGGGFGGCTINLVKADSVAEFSKQVARGYERATGLVPEINVCSTADGVAAL